MPPLFIIYIHRKKQPRKVVVLCSISLEFQMIAVKVDSWNQDLSPWRAPAVFGNEDFGEGASALLAQILELCKDESKTYYLGGYSLAGLFVLWASCQTDRFAGIAAASPSVWFPGFLSYVKEYTAHLQDLKSDHHDTIQSRHYVQP